MRKPYALVLIVQIMRLEEGATTSFLLQLQLLPKLKHLSDADQVFSTSVLGKQSASLMVVMHGLDRVNNSETEYTYVWNLYMVLHRYKLM